MRRPLEKSCFSVAQEVFTIIWMNEMNSGFRSPLVNVDTKIIERYAIGVKWGPIRSKYTEVLRCEIQNLQEFALSFPEIMLAPP